MSGIPDVSNLSTDYLRQLSKKSSAPQQVARRQPVAEAQNLSTEDIIKIASAIAQHQIQQTQQQSRAQEAAFQKVSARANALKSVTEQAIIKIAEVHTLAWVRDNTNIKLSEEVLKNLPAMLEKASEDMGNIGDAVAEGDYKDQLLTEQLIEAASMDPELAAQLIAEESPEDAMEPDEVQANAQDLAEAMAMDAGGEGESEEATEKKSSLRKRSSNWSELTQRIVGEMANKIILFASQS